MKGIDISSRKHSHDFEQDRKQRGESKTIWVIGITMVMMVVEISTGILFGSMALLADGMHMASHAIALGITAFAYVYARKHAHDASFSFGTGKVNALGGFSGALLLAVFAVMMAWESVARLISPTEIVFNQAILVAVLGLVVNGASVFILGDNHHHGHSHGHDHNLRSAYLHVMADALTSITAIVALLTAKYFGWIWMDPVMGIVGSLLVANWSLGLLRQTSGTLLDKQLDDHELEEIREAIEGDGHSRVVDLHAWAIGPGTNSVIVSVVSESPCSADEYRERLDSEEFQHITVEVNAL